MARTTRRTRHPLRRFGVLGLALSVTSAMLPLMPAHAEEPDSLAAFAAQGLSGFARSTEALGQLSPLADTIPGTATSAAQLVGFDAGFVPAALLEPLSAVDQVDELNNPALGDLTIGTEYQADVAATAVEADSPLTVDRQVDITLDISATRTIKVPLGYVDPNAPDADDPDSERQPLDLTGGTVPVVATADGTFEFVVTEVTNEDSTVTREFWMKGAPAFSVTVDGEDTALDFDGRYGFTNIDVTGSAAYDSLALKAAFDDPNGDGKIDQVELGTTLGADLFDAAFTGGDLDLDLDLDSNLLEGTADGTVAASETDLKNAGAYPPVSFTPTDGLAEFATINADDALLGVGQAGVALRSMLGSANTRLPFLDGFVADLYDPGKALFDFAEARANAVIVCGSADTLPPSGLLVAGGAAYCQAIAGNEAQSVTWSGAPSDGTDTATVGTSPTKNVRYDSVSLPLDINVKFQEVALKTAEDVDAGTPATPPTYTVVPRFATAQEMKAQLVKAGFDVDVAYNAADNALRFGVKHTTASGTVKVPFDVGDLLRPGANLSEITTTSGNPVPVTMTGGSLATTFGVRMGELDDVRYVQVGKDAYVAVPANQVKDVPKAAEGEFITRADLEAAGIDIAENPFTLEDRFTIDGSDKPLIKIEDIAVAARAATFDARIGMLPVTATTSNFKVASGAPALAVSLPTTPAGPIAISTLVKEHLGGVTAAVDLDASMTLAVTAQDLRTPADAAVNGTLTVNWADVAGEPLPAVTPDPAYALDLQPFDIRATVSGFVGAHDDLSTTTLVDPTADFLASFGLDAASLPLKVPAQLFNTSDGTMCGAFTIVNATTLTCDEPLAGGTDLEELTAGEALPTWRWKAGDAYQIPGDPEALRKVILESLVQVATTLENHENPVFRDTLPLLDLRPQDAAPQFTLVRETLAKLLTDIDGFEPDPSTTGVAAGSDADAAMKPAEEAPWATVGGLVTELEKRLRNACEKAESCVNPDDIAVDMTLNHRDHPTGTGQIAYLDLVITGLSNAGTAEVPLRIGLDDYTLTQPTDEEAAPAAAGDAEEPFRFDAEHTSKAQMGLGVPLAKGVPANNTLVLSDTGVTDLTVDVDTDEVDLEGAIGSVGMFVGKAASLRGTHVDLTVGVTDSTGVEAKDIIRNLTDASTCVVGAVQPQVLTCTEPMQDADGKSVAWAADDRFLVHEPTITFTGTHDGADDPAVLSTRSAVSDVVGDLLVNDTTGKSCVVKESSAYTAGTPASGDVAATEEKLATVTCEDGSGIAWTKTDKFSIYATLLDETYAPTTNATELFDPTADFVELGVEAGVILEKTNADGDSLGSCEVTEVAPGNDKARLLCDGLTNGQTWQSGDAYRMEGIGILRMSLSGSLLLDESVSVNGVLNKLVGTLKGIDHPKCDGDGTAADACAKLSLELMTVPEPEEDATADPDAEAPAPPRSYIGVVKVGESLNRTHTGGPVVEDAGTALPAAGAAKTDLSTAQVEALGISPLDWSLLPASTPYLAFLMGDALDGSAVGERLPLIGAQLDNGAEIEKKLLDLSGALTDVGYDLDTAIEGYTGNDIRTFIRSNIKTAFTAAAADNALLKNVTPVVTVACGECDTPASVDDIRVAFKVSETDTIGRTGFETGLPGLQMYADEDDVNGGPSGNIETKSTWSLDVAFGIDRVSGPYIAGGSGDEFTLSGTAKIGTQASCPSGEVANPSTIDYFSAGFKSNRCIDGRFGLLKGTMFDAAGDNTASDLQIRKTTVSMPRVVDTDDKLTFADLIDGVETTPEVDARGKINLLLRTSDPVDSGMALPRLLSVFTIDYDSAKDDSQGTHTWWHPEFTPRRTNGWTSPAYYDAVMDLGPFVESVLGPVLGEVSAIAKPLKPVIDTVSAPIPVISELHQLVGRGPLTMLDVLEKTSSNDLTLLRRVLASIQLAANLPASGNESVYVRLDSATDWNGGFKAEDDDAYQPNFTVDVADVEDEPCEIPEGGRKCKKVEHDWKNGQGKSTYDSIKKSENGKLTRHASGSVEASGAGITFPFLDDVRQVYGLFVGVDATLVRVDAGTLSATAGMTFSFGPFMAGPVPVEVQLGGAITLNGRFAMGYDTRGLSRMIAGEEPSNGSYLLDGLFIDDLDDSGKDVNEIELIVAVTAGASASLKIIKVGLEAEVTVTIGLNFNDPDKNGKLYLEEVMMWLENPICLFDVEGTLEFVLSLFFEVNLFIKKIKFTQVLYKLKPPLVLFEFNCSPPPPVWASKVGDDLVLNVGDRASARGQFTNISNEKFTVRQTGPTTDGKTPIEVTAFGIPLPYDIPAGGKLVAHTGAGSDTIRLLPGLDEEGNEYRFERASHITGFANGTSTTPTAGNNRFEGGDGDDLLVGGSTNDVLRGGAGNDTLNANAGNDALDGGTGSDLGYGGDGDDRLMGGPGRDLLHGGGNNDDVDGGPGLRGPAPRDRQGNVRTDLLDPGNLLVGGGGNDTLNGGPANDYLFGDDVATAAAAFQSLGSAYSADRTFLNDTFGSDAAKRATFCANASTNGTGGANTLAGHDGSDYLYGGSGADIAEGGRGEDLLCSGAGADQLHGGSGLDELWAAEGNDRLDGGVDNDLLEGGTDRDLLVDRTGSNVLVGGAGPDQLLGGDDGDLHVGDSLGVRSQGGVRAFAPGDAWPAPSADLTAGGAAITIDEAATAVIGAVTVCASGVVVLDGMLDLNGDRAVDAADDGWFEGNPVIDGKIDINRNGAIDGTAATSPDNGLVAGFGVNGGLVDLDGTGTPVTGDPLGTHIAGAAFSGSGNGDCIIAGAAADRLYGVDGGDRLDGGDGSDNLEANRGADFVRSGLGDDTAWGGDGNDVVHGDSGDDKLYAGADNDTVFGGPGNDYAEGNQDGDDLYGGDNDDTILGGSSNRTHPATRSVAGSLATAAGNDTINGDEGHDLAFGDNVHIDATTGALTYGTPAGLHGNDAVFGGPDDDVLMGQLGNDTIEGNTGRDYEFGDIAQFTLTNGRWATPPAWHGLVFPAATATDGATHWPGGAARYTVTLHLPNDGGDDVLFGNEDDDHVYAGAGTDGVEGGFGDDYIEGNGGADTIYGLAAEDASAAEAVAAILSTPSDQDVILGGSSAAHPSLLETGGAADVGDFLRGNADHDVILGDNGTADRQVNGTNWAVDTITGGYARTVTLTDRTRTSMTAVSGNDIALGDEANDRIYGTGGDDHLQGNDGDDSVEGNQGADWLEGDDGDDDLVGGSSCAATAVTCSGDADEGDLLFGGRGQDVAAGDNAVIRRATFASPYMTTSGTILGFTQDRWIKLNNASSGTDRISGGADDDVLFGEGADDWMSGGPGEDYMEGNARSDGMFGDRLLSQVGGVTKVRAAFGVTAPATADVLAVPAGLKALDAALPAHGLDRRLVASGLFDGDALAELEGMDAAPGDDEGQLDGQDDMVGGSKIAAAADFHDRMWGDGEADAMTGDNAQLRKTIDTATYKLRTGWYEAGLTDLPDTYGQRNLAIERTVTLYDDGRSTAALYDATAVNAWGDDYMDGGDGEDFMQGQDGDDEMWGADGNDVMVGRVGDDKMFGGNGHDGMLGARGGITRTYINAGDANFPTTTLTYNPPPFLSYQMFVPGRLHHEVTATMGGTVQAFDGSDLIRGGQGRDDLHGGAANDRINGDTGGDSAFGGDGNDAMWGGKGNPDGSGDRGADDAYLDYLYGGWGNDKLDYRPQDSWATSGTAAIRRLHTDWTKATQAYDHPDGAVQEATTQNHQGTDWIYGGWDADVLQANISQTGPNDGDRMIDWTGAYNLYTACPSDYGGYNHIRSSSPAMIGFLEQLAYSKGAGSLTNVKSAGTAAYRNVGLVYTKDNKANSGKAYADEFGKTPGHLFEQSIDCG